MEIENSFGQTALLLCYNFHGGIFFKEMFTAGADFHATDADNNTLLHYAAQKGDRMGAGWLVKFFMLDVTKTNSWGATALDIAIFMAKMTFDPQGLLNEVE